MENHMRRVMMIADAVRKFMLSCPRLTGNKINVNCLGTRIKSLSIDNVSSNPVIRKYCDGSMLMQAVFNLSVRDRYDENIGGSLYVSELLEDVENWIWQQNTIKNLPNLDKGMLCRSIEVTKSGHLYDTSMSNGRWQLEFRIVYKKMQTDNLGTYKER